MKGVFVLLLFMSSLIAFTNCGKVKERKMEDKLTYKAWTTYKFEQDGIDITSTSDYVATYSFHKDKGYIMEDNVILSNRAHLGSWSISGSTLTLTNNGTWKIRKLTDAELILKYTDSDYVMYLN